MRSGPSTTVIFELPPTRGDWVEFPSPECELTRAEADELFSELDAYWWSLGLTGAIVLTKLQWHTRPIVEERFISRNPLLTLNVNLRNRDGLLHADFPLLDIDTHQPVVPWATDDPRLVRLALEVHR